jgi:long-chain acyl-CoA synthetase
MSNSCCLRIDRNLRVISSQLVKYQLIDRMASASTPDCWKNGAAGPLETCVEAKLVDVPELGYFASNNPPQGEIWLRGPSITSGYLNRDQETAELLDKDGWLKTGDIGEFNKHGMLKVFDRVKNLVKTLNGEYIALEKVFPNKQKLILAGKDV